MLPLVSLVTQLLLVALVLTAVALGGAVAYLFARARRAEAPPVLSQAERTELRRRDREIAAIRSRIDEMFEMQRTGQTTQHAIVAQQIEQLNHDLKARARQVDGLQNQLRYEMQQRQEEMNELRQQLREAINVMRAPALAPASAPALPEARATETPAPTVRSEVLAPPRSEPGGDNLPSERVDPRTADHAVENRLSDMGDEAASLPHQVDPPSTEPAPMAVPNRTHSNDEEMLDPQHWRHDEPNWDDVEWDEPALRENTDSDDETDFPYSETDSAYADEPAVPADNWDLEAAPPVRPNREQDEPATSERPDRATPVSREGDFASLFDNHSVTEEEIPLEASHAAGLASELDASTDTFVDPFEELTASPQTARTYSGDSNEAGGDGIYESPPSDRPPAEPPAEAEDLTVIAMVNRERQQVLYELGVFTVEEVARWTQTDARRVAERLPEVTVEQLMTEWVFAAQSVLFDRYQAELRTKRQPGPVGV